MTQTEIRECRCDCGAPATNQALYRHDDGHHFLGSPRCDRHRYQLGRCLIGGHWEIVDYIPVVPVDRKPYCPVY